MSGPSDARKHEVAAAYRRVRQMLPPITRLEDRKRTVVHGPLITKATLEYMNAQLREQDKIVIGQPICMACYSKRLYRPAKKLQKEGKVPHFTRVPITSPMAATTPAAAATTPATATASASSSTSATLQHAAGIRQRRVRGQQSLLLLAMVGLPARGKSFLGAKIVSYMSWIGVDAQVFNAGSYRRAQLSAASSGRAGFFGSSNSGARDAISLAVLDQALSWLTAPPPTPTSSTAPAAATTTTTTTATPTPPHSYEHGGRGSRVAVFDATNTTRARRSKIMKRCSAEPQVEVVFLESVCNDAEVLRSNMLQKVLHSPDFAGLSEAEALADLRKRIEQYEAVYQAVCDEEAAPYIKVCDLASKVIIRHVYGHVARRIVTLMINCHIEGRPIYLCRAGAGSVGGPGDLNTLHDKVVEALGHGQVAHPQAMLTGSDGPYAGHARTTGSGTGSSCGSSGGAGGGAGASALASSAAASTTASNAGSPAADDLAQPKLPTALSNAAPLSSDGEAFAKRLAAYLRKDLSAEDMQALMALTSVAPRTVQTVAPLQLPPERHAACSALNTLDTGVCQGLTPAQIASTMPDEVAKWRSDPYRYRFVGGESMQDVVARLEDLVLEVEALRSPVLLVSHLATIQALYAYFMHVPVAQTYAIDIPRHCVVKLTPSQYGYTEHRCSLL